LEKTGVPIVLNTSLNENEPIVRTPAEAIDCFMRTEMDALILGSHLIDRRQPGFPAKQSTKGRGSTTRESVAMS
jgi:carbamoyltransferase